MRASARPSGESDFTRAARQQEVLSAMRDAIERGGFLNDPIGLLRAIGKTVQTNIPRKALPDLADYASKIDRKSTYRAVITHPLVASGRRGDPRGSIQVPSLKKIAALAKELFPTDGSLPVKDYRAPRARPSAASSSGVSSCGPGTTKKPTPKPTKKPTPKPTAKPSETPTPPPSDVTPSASTP